MHCFTGESGVEFLHYSARIQHEVREPVSAQCNMAVRDDLSSGDARRLALGLLNILSSSSSSSDEDDLSLNVPQKIPKIKNFVEVVHNLTDKDVSIYTYIYIRVSQNP